MSNGTILVVDDERTLARAIRGYLVEAGYEVEVAGDAEQALEMLDRLRPDVVFTDVRRASAASTCCGRSGSSTPPSPSVS